MIAPKNAKPTKSEETAAYELATTRDRGLCNKCGSGYGVQRDHRQNRQSGNTVVQNLQCLCLGCHKWKTEHPKEARIGGWAVSRHVDPLEWPARRRDHYGRPIWCLYDAEGGWREITAAEASRLMNDGLAVA